MPEEHNPWESGLKERQAKEKAEKEKKEHDEHEAALAKTKAEAEARVMAESMTPKPSVSLEEFAKVLNAAPGINEKVALLKARGSQLFKEGFPKLAADIYTKQLALQPSHQAYSNRSACRCALREYETALADAEACVSKAPEWAKGYARLGAALFGLYRWTEAIDAYERGLKVDPELAALAQGIDDARRRRAQAGGQWTVAVDGSREIEAHTRKGPERLPQLTRPLGLCAVLHDVGDAQVCAYDGDQIKLFSKLSGTVYRTFNEKFKDSGVVTLGDVKGFACDGDSMFTAEMNKGKPRLQRLMVVDSRSVGCRKEAPDKVKASVTHRDALGLGDPRGVCIADTSRMGGGLEGERLLYVCDAAHGRVLALEPKELVERFVVGRPGTAEGELQCPVGVAAHGDLLAIAEAGVGGEAAHRVSIFTLRGTFLRHVGERPSKFSSGARPGQFIKPPMFVALGGDPAAPTLFVLEAGGSRVHVLSPETGEPMAMLYPPHNLRADGADGSDGALTGLCVNGTGIYVSSNTGHGPARIMCLAKAQGND